MKNNAKERICSAMLDLLAERPIEKIYVTDIIAAAGVSRSTYYYYFCDPREVVSFIIESFCSGLTEAFDQVAVASGDKLVPSANTFIAMSKDTYFYMDTHSKTISTLLSGEYRGTFQIAVVNCIQESLKRFTYFIDEDGSGPKRLPRGELLDLYTRFLAYEAWATVEFSNDNNFELTPEELMATVNKCVSLLGRPLYMYSREAAISQASSKRH